MEMPPPIAQALAAATAVDDLILGFRFGVFFFIAGERQNLLDIRFAKVSGLSGEVDTFPVTEGGENLYTHRLPDRVKYGNLVLERGLVLKSRLKNELIAALTTFKFRPSNVIVTLYSEARYPLAAWMFFNAYPVKWSTADLDASEGRVVIETMELAYTRMQPMEI
jgi:phage tail-like protein